MSKLEGLYSKLPIPLQHLACSIEGWRIQRSRYGGDYPSLLSAAETRTFWSVEQVQEFRDQCLRNFVRHCAQTVPFYRRQFEERGISYNNIQTLNDLKYLPILTKQQVQENYPALLSEAVPRSRSIVAHTSGTTGGGLRFATTLQAMQEQWAVWWRYRRWLGIQQDTWCGYFGGRSIVPLTQTRAPFCRHNYPVKQILFSGYHMNSANASAYIAELRRRRPPWLHGYPSLLALLATYILESGESLGYRIRWITIGAENLFPQQASLIAEAFGVHPRQHYGMAEAVANISECEQGVLHVDEDFAATEFVANPDGPGHRIIGTNFTNLATPLLRYDTQDIAALTSLQCSCGRPGRLVASIDGRKEDYVILKSGARVGRMDHIFKDLINIREAQIHQKSPGAMTIRIVRGAEYQMADEAKLLREARQRVGPEMDIAIEYVEELRRSRTGKLRFVISEIPSGKLEAAS